MIVYIDTTGENSLTVAAYDESGLQVKQETEAVAKNESEKLLTAIDKVVDKDNLDGIVVVNGPQGRFSAIRTGVTAANALGFSLNIPVISVHDAGDITEAITQALAARSSGFIKPVTPLYSKEPNIGPY